MKPVRFSISTLLVVITAFAAYCGYAQWRRHSIIREYNALKKEGVHFSQFTDEWWPTAPRISVVIVEEDAPHKLAHNGTVYAVAEMQRRFDTWKRRAEWMGVGTVNLGVVQKDGYESLVNRNEFWEDYSVEPK